VGSAYRPAPAQCFGGPDWNFLTQIPAVNNLVMQDVWVEREQRSSQFFKHNLTHLFCLFSNVALSGVHPRPELRGHDLHRWL